MNDSNRDPSTDALFDTIERRIRDVLRDMLGNARAAVGSVESSILVSTSDDENLRFLVSVNPELEASDILVPCGGSIAGYAYSTGQLVAAADVAEEMGDRHFDEVDRKTGRPTKAYLVVPLTLGEQTIGVLTFHNRPPEKEGAPFPPEAIELAQEFATQCATLLRFYRRVVVQIETARGSLEDKAPEKRGGEVRGGTLEILERLETYSERDRAFIADLLDLLEKRRDEILLNDLGLGAIRDE